jgi:trehalose/maltose hydrolase-like predicted phosphorylase
VDASLAAVVFDWDGTAVADRHAPATAVRDRVERLCGLGVHVAVVSGTHVGNVDGQLAARPAGPGRLLLGLNRGSELFEVTASGPTLLRSVPETPRVADLLDAAAAQLAVVLAERGLPVSIVSSRLNRRKLDLIPDDDAWRDPPKAKVAALVAAVTARLRARGIGSISEVVDLAYDVAAAGGLQDARISSDAKHVEIGVTDKADSMRAILEEWAGLGVGPGLVLVAGDEFGPLGGVSGSDARMLVAPRMTVVSVGAEPAGVPDGVVHLGGGPARFLELLDEQLERRAKRRVPTIDPDPGWTVVESGSDPQRHRVTETLLGVGAGGFGTRGAVEEPRLAGRPLVVASGVYSGDGVDDGLLAGPDWTQVALDPAPETDRRVLDLRTGVLLREEMVSGGPPLRSMRFASIDRPGLMAMRLEAGAGRVGKGPAAGYWSVEGSGPGGIGMARTEALERVDGIDALERLAGLSADPKRAPSRRRAMALVQAGTTAGFDRLLCEHRGAWARRWEAVDVRVPDDEETGRALRFALHTLWSVAGPRRELAVGARGLSGPGYSGHVFWDADVFVLPALMTVDPASAVAMVRYRLNRLAAARDEAKDRGRAGARFPWESARTGRDVTPTVGFLGDEEVAILTGEQEEHITADVAWSVVRRAGWASVTGRLSPAERGLLAETARYWASRCRTDDDGRAHIESVIGPDEYHESVDDNAFTNVMARWNLRTAARRCPDVPSPERRAWDEIADALVDGYDASTGTHEQFRGYARLEPLLAADVGTPPFAADVLIGRERVAGSQLIKQPDVLMLHHLVPDEVVPGSLVPDLDLYAPRTAHGSSLSPAVMALLAARAGRPEEALELLRFALRIDLEDLGGTTSAGLHLGTAGGAWQAVLFGFLGLQVSGGVLRVRPCLPSAWRHLEVRFRCLGSDVRLRLDDDVLTAAATRSIRAARDAGTPVTLHGKRLSTLTEGDRP